MITTNYGNGLSQSEEDGVVEIKLEHGFVYRAVMNEPVIPVNNFLVFYDFDQTIATHHIWDESNGCEISQFRNLFTKEQLAIFLGGNERIERLRAHFIKLTEMGAKLFVVSFGDRLVNSFVLKTFDMLQYFEDVYRGRKPSYVKAHMEVWSCDFDHALFVDDDIRNVKQVGRYCHSIHIPQRKGMKEEDLQEIERRTTIGLGLMREESEPVYIEEQLNNLEVPYENALKSVEDKEKTKVISNEEGDNDRIKEDLKNVLDVGDATKVEEGKSEPGVQDPAFWDFSDGEERRSSGAQPLQMKGIDIADSPLG